jgi:hypothetical protein
MTIAATFNPAIMNIEKNHKDVQPSSPASAVQ